MFISKLAKEIIFDNLNVINRENEELRNRIADLEEQVQSQQSISGHAIFENIAYANKVMAQGSSSLVQGQSSIVIGPYAAL